MTRGNYLSFNSHSIFHTMKHQHEKLFWMWKIWTPHFPPLCSSTTTKNYTSGRKLCDMIKDDDEIYIFQHTNNSTQCYCWVRQRHDVVDKERRAMFSNFHCVPLCHCDFSSWKFCRNFALNDVKDAILLLPSPLVLLINNVFLSTCKINFILNGILNCLWYLSLAHALTLLWMRGAKEEFSCLQWR